MNGEEIRGGGVDKIGRFIFNGRFKKIEDAIEFEKKYLGNPEDSVFYNGTKWVNQDCYGGNWERKNGRGGNFILMPRRMMEGIEKQEEEMHGIGIILARDLLEDEFAVLAAAVGETRNHFPFAPPF
jgi:hypothetical protein